MGINALRVKLDQITLAVNQMANLIILRYCVSSHLVQQRTVKSKDIYKHSYD